MTSGSRPLGTASFVGVLGGTAADTDIDWPVVRYDH
jgi:hypothetical protein